MGKISQKPPLGDPVLPSSPDQVGYERKRALEPEATAPSLIALEKGSAQRFRLAYVHVPKGPLVEEGDQSDTKIQSWTSDEPLRRFEYPVGIGPVYDGNPVALIGVQYISHSIVAMPEDVAPVGGYIVFMDSSQRAADARHELWVLAPDHMLPQLNCTVNVPERNLARLIVVREDFGDIEQATFSGDPGAKLSPLALDARLVRWLPLDEAVTLHLHCWALGFRHRMVGHGIRHHPNSQQIDEDLQASFTHLWSGLPDIGLLKPQLRM